MSKITKWVGIGAAVFGTALFLFANQTMAEKEGTASHGVVKGDTLWGITSSYLKDPFLWPKVWKANPDIKNPDLIYPGQKVAIPGAPAKPAKDEAEAKAEEREPPRPWRPPSRRKRRPRRKKRGRPSRRRPSTPLLS